MDDSKRACIACKWCDWPHAATGSPAMLEVTASCRSEHLVGVVSMVTGEAGEASCLVTRLFGGCGELGLWWEQRKGATGA